MLEVHVVFDASCGESLTFGIAGALDFRVGELRGSLVLRYVICNSMDKTSTDEDRNSSKPLAPVVHTSMEVQMYPFSKLTTKLPATLPTQC
jgi:hypothetical protein